MPRKGVWCRACGAVGCTILGELPKSGRIKVRCDRCGWTWASASRSAKRKHREQTRP
jgi:hypothetical protein